MVKTLTRCKSSSRCLAIEVGDEHISLVGKVQMWDIHQRKSFKLELQEVQSSSVLGFVEDTSLDDNTTILWLLVFQFPLEVKTLSYDA